MEQTIYDVDYFISKFEKIPEEKWIIKVFNSPDGRRCAYGHCGVDGREFYENITEEFKALQIIDSQIKGDPELLLTPIKTTTSFLAQVNDGINVKYQQPTPKQRILAALYDYKKILDAKNGTINAATKTKINLTESIPLELFEIGMDSVLEVKEKTKA